MNHHPAAAAAPALAPFSPYQKTVVAMLAFLQFAVILDFMLMAPMGALIMPALKLAPSEFGLVVSAYAFSAAASGLLTAGFADRFDRKKLLLFFYGGFVLGTVWCGLAQSFQTLLAARIATGLFGGVIGSIVIAIATDLFPPQMRGRVMGTIQTAFAASQVLGIPIGLYLSNHWNWHVPFLALAAIGVVGGFVVSWRMQPVVDHLKAPQEHSPWVHLLHTLTVPRHLLAFATTALLSTGGFMLMPFSSAFIVNNFAARLADGVRDHGHLHGVHRADDRQGRRPVRHASGVRLRLRPVDRDGADLHAPRPGLAAHGDPDQRGAFRRHLLAHHPGPGLDVAGAHAEPARRVQRNQRVGPAAVGRPRLGHRRPHRRGRRRPEAAALRHGRVCRRGEHVGLFVPALAVAASSHPDGGADVVGIAGGLTNDCCRSLQAGSATAIAENAHSKGLW
jgi:hypothetical protein